MDITNGLIAAIENNKLKLPSQPEVVVRIRECVENPQTTIDQVSQLINHDPALAAKFIQVANSPALRGSVLIESLPHAVSRLGLAFVSQMATAFAMEQIFQATNETIDKLMYETWSYSTYVAAYAHAISKHISSMSAEKAALAGLMHQIGTLPILSYAQDDDALLQNQNLLLQTVKDHHWKLSSHILQHWHFPEEIVALPLEIYEPLSEHEIKQPGIHTVLQLAILEVHKIKQNPFIDIEKIPTNYYEMLNNSPVPLFEQTVFKKDVDKYFKIYCSFN